MEGLNRSIASVQPVATVQGGKARGLHTRMDEAVSLKVVTLVKPHVTHGASIRFHP